MSHDHHIIKCARYAMICSWVVLVLGVAVVIATSSPSIATSLLAVLHRRLPIQKGIWVAPDSTSIPNTREGKLITYGRELVSHTAVYLGPKGKVKAITNGMNCQNCHLKAGTVLFGNNYSAVASTYPKHRDRSGTEESIERRVNDCIERSLNGTQLPDRSLEMRAIVAYIRWVGKDVPKDSVPEGAGIKPPPYLSRAADSVKGKVVYQTQCSRCHGQDGKGILSENGIEWKYPPLHGEHSFNIGAGLLRISRFAGYIKANMPNDKASYDKPVLSDEEAWDVAAYIVSLPRPSKDISADWPDISTKPVDHPYGPFADNYSEEQHKYGPFQIIQASAKKKKKKKEK
jgi:thiosulfate dehydrogenase